MTYYIAHHSVKPRMLAKIAADVCKLNSRKLLVFLDWSVTQWTVAMSLVNLGS